MSGQIKVGGSWHNTLGVKVNVAGTWRTVSKGLIRVGGTWVQWIVSAITDSFNRANSGSLGNAETGQAWMTIRGSAWGIVSNKASNSSGSNAIAAVELGSQNAAVVVDGVASNGGAAFWVTDSGSWWASTIYDESYQCNPQTVPLATFSYLCESSPTGGSYLGDCVGAFTDAMNTCQGSIYDWSCTPGTTTIYDTCYRSKLRISKMVSNSYTADATGAGDATCSEIATKIEVSTSGNAITVVAKKANGTQVGTKSYTATSPTKGTKHGIIAAAAATIDSFSATPQ